MRQRKNYFFKKRSKLKIIFEKLKLKNWEIIMMCPPFHLTIPRMDTHGYRCLNFFDTILRNVIIKFSGSKCEDAVNFVRSEGILRKLRL